MQNFQLYRSNVLLGGQMKYDLVVNSIKSTNKLYINEFHITPISNRAPYNKYVDENDLLNYTHQENISRYYKKFSGSFYNDYTDPRLTSLHPLTDKDKCKRYNDTYEMGCRRMEYGLYNTAFNFFCPIWLECIDLDSEKSISFEFKLYTDQEHKKLISCNELKLKIDENLPAYHNKFII